MSLDDDKIDTKPKKRFYKWMLAGSWIFGAMTVIEVANSSSNNTWWFTTVWLATMLCLIFAGNEYILLARDNAPVYNKAEFEALLNDCLDDSWNKKLIQKVIVYFMQLNKVQKAKLIDDFSLMTNHIEPEIDRYQWLIWSIKNDNQLLIEMKDLYQKSIDLNKQKMKLYPWLLKKLTHIMKRSFI